MDIIYFHFLKNITSNRDSCVRSPQGLWTRCTPGVPRWENHYQVYTALIQIWTAAYKQKGLQPIPLRLFNYLEWLLGTITCPIKTLYVATTLFNRK